MTSSQVVDGKAAFAFDGLEGAYVACGEVAYVDVVADSGAVRGVVVIAEYTEFLAEADCGLRDVGHEIVRNSVRVFADTSARVRANRVEVAEQNHVPFWVSFLHVHEHFFEHGLCLSIGVGAMTFRAFFGNRDLSRVAVNGGRRTENDVLAAVVSHGVEEHECRVHVVFVVFERLCNGFADGLEPGKVNACVKLIFAKDFVHGGGVTDVCVYEWNGGSYEFAHAAEGFVAGIYKVIDDNDGMACFVKFNNCMASDISSTTHYGYFHFCSKDKSSVRNIEFFSD